MAEGRGTSTGRYLIEMDGVAAVRSSEVSGVGLDHQPFELFESNRPNPRLGRGHYKIGEIRVKHAVALNNSVVTLAGGSTMVFTGPVSLGGLNNAVSVTNTASTIITGTISDNTSNPGRALTKLGSGTLTLAGANTYSAQTNILQGAINVQNNLALGTTPSQPSVNSTANASVTNPSPSPFGSKAKEPSLSRQP